MSRIFNFSAGPATLPVEVLKEAQEQLLDYNGSGMSIMESSHRAAEYAAVHEEVKANIAKLAGLNDDYSILFLGGGASTQFALVPMNLCADGQAMDYTSTGAWASKAIKEAKLRGPVNVVADTSKDSPACMPDPSTVKATDGAAYLHVTSNETIAGTQWKAFPDADVPLVADMSSDMFSRPFDISKFGCIYAGAQKNLGPAGVTLVIVRKDLAERVSDKVPMILRYKSHIEKDSLLNTPPCFPVYILMLVTRWILKNGGLQGIAAMNEAKASKLYAAIDASSFYNGTAAVNSRSLMNVTFRLPTEELEAKFVKEAKANSMSGLKGHRSVGGIRASIYNAFPEAGVDALIDFMKEFERTNG
jgi:phosphoserine aminotransferase